MTIPTIRHVTYIARDISCGHCIAKVQDALRDVDGIKDVHASVETRFVDVDYDPAVVSTMTIENVLATAGFPVQQ